MNINSFLRSATVCLSVLYLSFNLSAQEEDPFFEGKHTPLKMNEEHPTKLVHVYTEMIEITSLEYAEIMSQPFKSSNQTVLRNTLIENVKNGKAKLFSNQSVVTRAGDVATALSIKELIYETEYETAQSISEDEVSPFNPIASSITKSPTDSASKTKSIIFPPTPTAFETRDIGSTLEVENLIDPDEKIITLGFKPDIIQNTGYHVLTEWNTVLSKSKVQMPIFYKLSIRSTLTLKDGEFTLVGTHTPDIDGKADNTKKLLVFVKASIMDIEK